MILFVGILVVNVAGQGYERHIFTSSNFDPTSSYSFPTNFLRASLKDEPGCEPLLIRQGDGIFPSSQGFSFPLRMTKWSAVFRTNHSLFEYKVIDVANDSISYADVTLVDCFVEEILVKNTKNLNSSTPFAIWFLSEG